MFQIICTDLLLQEQGLLNSMQFIIALQVPNIVPNFKNIFYYTIDLLNSA